MQRVIILYDASQAVLSTFDLDEVLNQILEIVRYYFNLQSGSIYLLDETAQKLTVRAHFGDPVLPADGTIPFGQGITGTAAKARRPIYSPDVTVDPRYQGQSASTRSELAIPLMVRDEVVGVLDCHSDHANAFDHETVDLMMLFATQASIGLQNAKLYSQLQRRAAQLEAINSIAKRTTVEVDLKELLDRLCALIPSSFPVEHVSIFLRDDDGNLVLAAQQGSLPIAIRVGGTLPEGHAYTGGTDEHDELCLPLVSFGENLGVLAVAAKSRALVPNEFQALESLADILATATQNARYVDRVRQLAYRDGLTGVFNRRYFESRLVEEIARASRYGSGVSILMVDVDHFKKINDDFGHMLGDDVLRGIAGTLQRNLRKVDVVCRYGGEEFAVILPSTCGANAYEAADKLRRAVSLADYRSIALRVTISVGVAEFPTNGLTRDDLLRAADAALYKAKQSGRDRVCWASANATPAPGA